MGKMADKGIRQATEQAAALVPEPLIDIAMVNRCGVMGQITRETLENIGEGVFGGELPGTVLGPDHIYRDGQKLAKIPPAFMFAVTASTVLRTRRRHAHTFRHANRALNRGELAARRRESDVSGPFVGGTLVGCLTTLIDVLSDAILMSPHSSQPFAEDQAFQINAR